MFRTRLVSGIVLVVLLVYFLVAGEWPLWRFWLAISLIGLFELYRVFGIQDKAYGYLGYGATVFFYLNLRFHFLPGELMLVVFFLLVSLFIFVLSYPEHSLEEILQALFGVIYVGVMLSFIYQTRLLDKGAGEAGLIFVTAWGCDTCAYCGGMLWGKHKMAPVLSPKKSVEGAISGVVGAAILGILYCFLIHIRTKAPVSLYGWYALICGAGAVFSQLGDLSASAIKRIYGVKDYGKVIPGHGGIMDRFDSVIVTSPMIYCLSWYLLH